MCPYCHSLLLGAMTPCCHQLRLSRREKKSGLTILCALQLLRLLSPLPCYRLVPGGTPDDTAATIERTLEAVWA